MAFLVDDIVKTLEYRGRNERVGNDGRTWVSLKFEDLSEDARVYEIGVPQDLQGDVYRVGLRKGDIVQVVFLARQGRSQSGRDYGYLQLQRVPVIVEVDEDGVVS